MEVDMRLRKIKIMKISVECLFDMALKHVESDDFPADAKLVYCTVDPCNPTVVMLKMMSDSFEEIPEHLPFPVFNPVFKEKP